MDNSAKISKLPALLEYASYVLYYPSIICGFNNLEFNKFVSLKNKKK